MRFKGYEDDQISSGATNDKNSEQVSNASVNSQRGTVGLSGKDGNTKVDEDVLVQGSNYQPDENEEDVLEGGSGSDVRQRKSINMPSGKGKLLILGGAVFAILAVSFLGVYSVQQNKKIAKEREDALMAAIDDYEFVYTDVEVAQLRAYGYIADEIESYQAEGRLFEQLIQEAKDEIKDTYDKEIAVYKDPETPEFKQLKDLTWLYGSPIEYDSKLAHDVLPINTKEVALDYIKVPPYGMQLWIRIKNNEEYIFHSVDPAMFVDMPETGKVIVIMQYKKINDTVIVTDVNILDYNK